MTTQVHSCRSCGIGFTSGRGINGNRFCSDRCMNWYDAGGPMHGDVRKGHGPYRVVAGPNDATGQRHPFTCHDLVAALGVPAHTLGTFGLDGRRGKISYRSPGRWEIVIAGRDRREIKRLDCVTSDDGRLYLNRLPDTVEAAAICRIVGIRRSPTWATLDNETGSKNVQETLAPQGFAKAFTPFPSTYPLARV